MGSRIRIISIMLLVTVLSAIFLPQTLAAWVPPPKQEYEYHIYGYAKDSVSGNGIGGVLVKVYRVHDDTETYLGSRNTASSGYFSFTYTFLVPIGDNDLFRVKLSKEHYNSVIKSKPAKDYTYFGSIYMTNPIEKYAVLVFSTELASADADRDNWVQSLQNQAFTDIRVYHGIFDSSDKLSIRNDVQSVAALADWNDVIVFAYSGHGDIDLLALRAGVSSTYYTASELKNDLTPTGAKGVLIFLEACLSGSFVDDFAGMSQFFVLTATDEDGSTSAMSSISPRSKLNPPNPIDSKKAGNAKDDGMWTYFFLGELNANPSASLESVFSSAMTEYRSWYISEKWVWQPCCFVGDKPYYKWQWDDTWLWPLGGERCQWRWHMVEGKNGEWYGAPLDPPEPIGNPQLGDGNPSSSFYL